MALSIAALAIGMAAPAYVVTASPDKSPRKPARPARRSSLRPAHGSIATGNRHGGGHLHKREIARHRRQRLAAS